MSVGIAHGRLHIRTSGESLTDVSGDVQRWLDQTRIATGTLSLFCRHTSAGLLISENADPSVQRDLLRWLDRSAPQGDRYEHDCEGPDDMPAHIKSVVTGGALTVPFAAGRLLLGTWQAIYLAEFREQSHQREVVLTAIGE